MNSEEVRDAMYADASFGWGEPWRRHVRVLQEYVLEIAEALREAEGQNAHSEQQVSTFWPDAESGEDTADAISRPNSRVDESS